MDGEGLGVRAVRERVSGSTGTMPRRLRPSSVRVPVWGVGWMRGYRRISGITLSKQTRFTLPAILIILGEMQNIPSFFKRFWACNIPTVNAAGKAGGTTIVTMSNARRMIAFTSLPF